MWGCFAGRARKTPPQIYPNPAIPREPDSRRFAQATRDDNLYDPTGFVAQAILISLLIDS